jgi:ABC-type glutathione transport system ATPase component
VGLHQKANANAGAAVTARIRYPKVVETKSERDKLMFRIRVRIDPERLRARADAVRSGLPGVAYLRLDPAVAWPPQCRGTSGNERSRAVARIEGVTQRYGTAVALDAVTIELPAGCMVGCIGPDGVGKSSLLGIVTGARQVQSGNVFVLDADVEDSAHSGGVIAQYVQKGVFSGDADFTAPVCSRRIR